MQGLDPQEAKDHKLVVEQISELHPCLCGRPWHGSGPHWHTIGPLAAA